jgi:hypothetical protein
MTAIERSKSRESRQAMHVYTDKLTSPELLVLPWVCLVTLN